MVLVYVSQHLSVMLLEIFATKNMVTISLTTSSKELVKMNLVLFNQNNNND